jgi:hypothetical protein
MPCFHIVVAVLATTAVVGSARAQPGPPPEPVDAARLQEKYVIEPGAEALFADMLGSGQTLPAGCTFGDGQIERTSVLGTYTCGGAQVVLQLLHPELAPRGAVRTQRFAVTVKRGTPPAGLVEAVAERVRARETAFEWKTVEDGRSAGEEGTPRWMVWVGAAGALLVFWGVRRVVMSRRRPA